MRTISQAGLDFIKGFESFVPYVYDDKLSPVRGRYREWDRHPVRGTLTIGYGHTDSAKHHLKIANGLKITEAEACDILDVDLDECEEAVNRLVRKPLTQGQFDALVSFAFNCGTGNLKKLIIPLNNGDYAGTRAKFDLYVKSKGEFMRGLQRRRDGEQELWDERDVVLPTETVEHPAEVDPEVKPQKTDLGKVSKKVRTLRSVGSILHSIWMSIAAYFGAAQIPEAQGVINDVKQLVESLALPATFVGVICGLLLIRYLVNRIAEDQASGRYIPSGNAQADQ